MSNKVEFGDFQTPAQWAEKLTIFLLAIGIDIPRTIIEPTCGIGAFVHAATRVFPSAKIYGFDINKLYVKFANQSLSEEQRKRTHLECRGFFDDKFLEMFTSIPAPVLFLGNPPWVTNSKLGVIGSHNLPKKNNHLKLKGIDAITGKSNFDISEWMICRMLEALQEKQGNVAMICKSIVARKVLAFAAARKFKFSSAKFVTLNSKEIFDASVDCGFFIFESKIDRDYKIKLLDLNLNETGEIGLRKNRLVADTKKYDFLSFLDGANREKWRSGMKHDCSSIFELKREGNYLVNGLGQRVEIEDEFVFPFLKSSDIANNRLDRDDRFVVVTQRAVGENTGIIQNRAPKTWQYLYDNHDAIANRKSSIYRGKSPFSIFGIGPYSFAQWKVAISGLYKSLNFVKVGPRNNKPTILDDTCYFLPCDTEKKADILIKLLSSTDADQFFRSIIFWDSKRPVNADVLQRLELDRIPIAEAGVYASYLDDSMAQQQFSLSTLTQH